MSELKPCPRCGTKAYLSRDVVDGFYFGWSAGCPRYCHYDGIHGTTIDTSEEDCYAVHGANSKEEATGGQSGDQTGREIWCTNYYNFPWNYVLRLSHSESGGSSGGASAYIVKWIPG